MDQPMEVKIGNALLRNESTLAVAESCTGGLIAHRITEVPGSSNYFLGGIVAYSNAAKKRFLGVSPTTLDSFGAVSEETALEMARGVRSAFDADYGVSVTGIAGPGSDDTEKPVGLTWIALSTAGGDRAEKFVWEGDRSSNKLQSAEAALQILLQAINPI
jgi:PncC family amidohydrolase